jgi:hypothetical protein
MDLIDLLPPGLYEAVITGIDETIENPDLVRGEYLFSVERRKLDDIRALGGNSREDDMAFAAAARVSEIGQGLYRTCLGPAMRMAANEPGAEFLRSAHPNRLRFEGFSDRNPVMLPVAAWAEAVRDNRRPVRPDNPFLPYEHLVSEWIANGLKAWGDARDALGEAVFFNIYGSPLLQAMLGLRADAATQRRPIERDLAREALANRTAAHFEQRIDQGGAIEAAVRALIYIRSPEGKVDERGFAAMQEVGAALPAAKRVGLARLKEIVREQSLILLTAEERAIAALPKLLPQKQQERASCLAAVRRVVAARGVLPPEGKGRLERVEALFAVSPEAADAQPQHEAADG